MTLSGLSPQHVTSEQSPSYGNGIRSRNEWWPRRAALQHHIGE